MARRQPRPSGAPPNGDLAKLRGAQAREALRAAHARLEEVQASGDLLRRVRQLRSQLQEELAIARDRFASTKGARAPRVDTRQHEWQGSPP
jgi:hypothetical protein